MGDPLVDIERIPFMVLNLFLQQLLEQDAYEPPIEHLLGSLLLGLLPHPIQQYSAIVELMSFDDCSHDF